MHATSLSIGDARIQLVQGDIVTQQVDVIVNAANCGLRGGGGVDGAIHRAGGPAIMAECRKIGHCPTGGAVMTTAGNLPASRIIHTVGPVWHGGNSGEPELLRSCYANSLQLADKEGFASIAFPSISTGVYGYPVPLAAEIALQAIADTLPTLQSIRLATVVLYSNSDFLVYTNAIESMS